MFDQWHVDPTRASSPSGSETRMGGGGHRPSPRWAALRAVWPRSHEHPRAMAMVMVGSIFTVSWSMVHGLNTWSRWCVMAMNMEKQCHQCDIWTLFVVGGFQKYLPLCGSHPWGRQNEEIQHDSALYSSTKNPGVGVLLGEVDFEVIFCIHWITRQAVLYMASQL